MHAAAGHLRLSRTAVSPGTPRGEPSKTRLTIKSQAGAARFLKPLQKCLAASLGLAIEGDRRAQIRLAEKSIITYRQVDS